ncbi:hypothetical protein BD410DRAFT_791176 [Rickenella mellea]|uniref:Secreted protein n=1 Tax=Rickenella mellea TaxID=50990 RepID=A0A4Y7PY84_9AGAM|nr:hypothetical protein BD410DRAFT_791176 [Rickenella mellea]
MNLNLTGRMFSLLLLIVLLACRHSNVEHLRAFPCILPRCFEPNSRRRPPRCLTEALDLPQVSADHPCATNTIRRRHGVTTTPQSRSSRVPFIPS